MKLVRPLWRNGLARCFPVKTTHRQRLWVRIPSVVFIVYLFYFLIALASGLRNGRAPLVCHLGPKFLKFMTCVIIFMTAVIGLHHLLSTPQTPWPSVVILQSSTILGCA
jgi:fumarate reductase subunit C